MIAIIAAFVGLKVVKSIVDRTGKDSILVFVLAFVILGSAIVIPVQALKDFVEKYNDGLNVTGFKPYCTK